MFNNVHVSQEDSICSQILVFGHLLVIFNSSVNFLVYSLGDSKIIIRYIRTNYLVTIIYFRLLRPN